MQNFAVSLQSRRLSVPSPSLPWSLTAFRSMAKSSYFPAYALCKLPGLVPGSRLLSLLVSPAGKKAVLRLAMPQNGEAFSEESPIPFINQTTTDQDETDEPSIPVKFILQKSCKFGEKFTVVGSDPLFGSWDPLAGIPMEWSEGHVWTAELDVPLGRKIEFKFVLTGKHGDVEWQPGQNCVFETAGRISPLVVSEQWEPVISEDSLKDEVSEEVTVPVIAEAADVELISTGVIITGIPDSFDDAEGDSSEGLDEVDGVNGRFPFSDSNVDGESQAAPEIVPSPETTFVASTIKEGISHAN